MTHNCLLVVIGFLMSIPGTVLAQAVAPPVCRPVNHPLITSQPIRTASTWRRGVEGFGETVIRSSLELRGYGMQDMKLPGNHGIDLFAVKRNAAGKLIDLKIVEAKAHYGKGMPHLGNTAAGRQMSRKWLADRLRALRNAGQEGKRLALDISRFRREKGIPISCLGEVHDINLRSGKYTIREPATLRPLTSPVALRRSLGDIASHSKSSSARAWAGRQLVAFDRIRDSRMGRWISGTPRSRASAKLSQTRFRIAFDKAGSRSVIRALSRTAGRIAFAVAVAMDAAEVYGHVRDYQQGSISRRELHIALARSGGGIAGAWACAYAGAWLGGQIGALGGPFAWITVPAGVFIGGTIAGIVGYYAGSYAGDIAAKAFYGSLDAHVRDRVNEWFVETGNPFGA